jgi:hypothetical protein
MKMMIVAVLLLSAAALLPAPAQAACSTCNVTAKTPSTTQPGKFDYTFSCIQDASGDEVVSKVTAATDDEAKTLAAAKC